MIFLRVQARTGQELVSDAKKADAVIARLAELGILNRSGLSQTKGEATDSLCQRILKPLPPTAA